MMMNLQIGVQHFDPDAAAEPEANEDEDPDVGTDTGASGGKAFVDGRGESEEGRGKELGKSDTAPCGVGLLVSVLMKLTAARGELVAGRGGS